MGRSIDENAEEIATLDAIDAGKLYHTIRLRLMKFPQQKIPYVTVLVLVLLMKFMEKY